MDARTSNWSLLTRRKVEGKQPPLVQLWKNTLDYLRPELRSSQPPRVYRISDQKRSVGEGEDDFLKLFACLQWSIGCGKADPEITQRICIKFYLHISEAASVDTFEDRRGGAYDSEEVLDVHINSAWGDNEDQRGQVEEQRSQ